MDYLDGNGLRPTFYRVACKAAIRDDAGRLLVVADDTGTFELPGGGWEHDENFEACLRREIKEELGVEAVGLGNMLFAYQGPGPRHPMLRIVAEAELASHNFSLDEDEVTQARFVDRSEFLVLAWCEEDRGIIEYVDKLWPPVEKKSSER